MNITSFYGKFSSVIDEVYKPTNTIENMVPQNPVAYHNSHYSIAG